MLDTILNRRSIRKYEDKKVSDELLTKILEAAMEAPSAGNAQPWEFIVIKDKETIKKINVIHPHSKMAMESDLSIIVCADVNKEVFEGFWPQDCSAATENILLAAEELGLGSVWLGVYPKQERMDGIKELLKLPESVIPFSMIPIGYKAETKSPGNRFNKDRIHYEQW